MQHSQTHWSLLYGFDKSRSELKQTSFIKSGKNSNWSITWLSTYSTGFMTLKYEQTLRNNSTILSHWAPFIFLIHDDKIQRFSVFFFMNKPSAAKYNIRILFLWASKWAKSTLYILSVLRKCQQHRHTHNAHNAEMFFLSTSTQSAIFFSTKAHVNSSEKKWTLRQYTFLYKINWFYKFVILIIVFAVKIIPFNIRVLQNSCWKMQFFLRCAVSSLRTKTIFILFYKNHNGTETHGRLIIFIVISAYLHERERERERGEGWTVSCNASKMRAALTFM